MKRYFKAILLLIITIPLLYLLTPYFYGFAPLVTKHFPQGFFTKVNPPEAKKIYRYTYQGKAVYFVPGRCCDQMSAVYDEELNFLCSPDGGITGNGDGKCADFYEQRSDEKVVWPK